jgi:hypothetical protein
MAAMVKRLFFCGFALALAAGLGGCESFYPGPVSASAPPPRAVAPGVAAGLTGPLDLGDWRSSSEAAVLQRFSAHVLRRWPTGTALAAAAGDLTGQGFACAPPRTAAGGDPPDRACKREAVAAGCTHVWQVYLYDDAGAVRLSRVRALYDKRCGRDGLAGGPD